MIQSDCETALKKNEIAVHNYYTCSANSCNSISKEDQTKVLKYKNFQRKRLLNPDLICYRHSDIWSLCYVDNKGMFCALCQSHNGMHWQSKITVCNKKRNLRYRPETIRGHFIKAKDVKYTMHYISAQKEDLKHLSFFIREHQKKERTSNACYEKVFTSLCWLCKEKIAVSKAVLYFNLHEKLGMSDIASFTTRSPATIRSMITVLPDNIKEELLKKNQGK